MNEPRNPYSPPRTHVADRDEVAGSTDSGRFVPYGRTVPAGRGAAWIGDAWRLLRAQPGMWAALLILLFVAYVVASMIPLLNFFTSLLTPFVTAAIALAADEQRRTGTFDLKVMTRGFEKQPVSLLAVGGMAILAGVVFLIILAIFLGSDIIGAMAGGSNPDPSTFLSTKFWLAFLIGLAVVLPIGFATYLAPQLILLHDQPAITAMKMSLAGTVKNILPGLVFGVCAFLMMIVSMIPLFLGLLITMPILAITNYTVYRDIFVEEHS
ncbi:MAG TPA: BPSS1780 family membrane protein [Planctomycetaceae bacterium]|nr:BPSS1780 family membrane protein [Planctomycetaceae bacterium]